MVILPHFTPSMLRRSLLAWAFVRLAAIAGTSATEGALHLAPSNPLHLSPGAALFVVGVAAAGWISERRRNEDAFLLCLGYSRARQLASFAAPAALLELAMAMAIVA
jgi:hypothetical protein